MRRSNGGANLRKDFNEGRCKNLRKFFVAFRSIFVSIGVRSFSEDPASWRTTSVNASKKTPKNRSILDCTKTAFAHQSTFSLQRGWLLFSLLRFPWVVKIVNFIVLTAIRIRLPIDLVIKHTMFKQFCGGQTLEECVKLQKHLAQYGVESVFDFASEGGHSETSFRRTFLEIKKSIRTVQHHATPLAVFKITGLAHFTLLERVSSGDILEDHEALQWHKLIRRVRDLCKLAKELGVLLIIDAEESWIQKAIDQIAENMMIEFNREHAVVFKPHKCIDTIVFFTWKNLLRLAEERTFM